MLFCSTCDRDIVAGYMLFCSTCDRDIVTGYMLFCSTFDRDIVTGYILFCSTFDRDIVTGYMLLCLYMCSFTDILMRLLRFEIDYVCPRPVYTYAKMYHDVTITVKTTSSLMKG